jgi:hypothetical protein
VRTLRRAVEGNREYRGTGTHRANSRAPAGARRGGGADGVTRSSRHCSNLADGVRSRVLSGAGHGRCCAGAAQSYHRRGGGHEILRRRGVRDRFGVAISRPRCQNPGYAPLPPVSTGHSQRLSAEMLPLVIAPHVAILPHRPPPIGWSVPAPIRSAQATAARSARLGELVIASVGRVSSVWGPTSFSSHGRPARRDRRK